MDFSADIDIDNETRKRINEAGRSTRKRIVELNENIILFWKKLFQLNSITVSLSH